MREVARRGVGKRADAGAGRRLATNVGRIAGAFAGMEVVVEIGAGVETLVGERGIGLQANVVVIGEDVELTTKSGEIAGLFGREIGDRHGLARVRRRRINGEERIELGDAIGEVVVPGRARSVVGEKGPAKFGIEGIGDVGGRRRNRRGGIEEAGLPLLEERGRIENVVGTEEGIGILFAGNAGGEFFDGVRTFESGLGDLFVGEHADFEDGKEEDGIEHGGKRATRRRLRFFAADGVAKPFGERDDDDGDGEDGEEMKEGCGAAGFLGALGDEDEKRVAGGDAPGSGESADEADAEAGVFFWCVCQGRVGHGWANGKRERRGESMLGGEEVIVDSCQSRTES